MKYYCEAADGEVYWANTAKVLASVARFHNISLEEAKRRMDASDSEHPIKVDDEMAWAEED